MVKLDLWLNYCYTYRKIYWIILQVVDYLID